MSTELRINQQFAKLKLNIKPPEMSLQTDTSAEFSIDKQEGKLKINTRHAKVEINYDQTRAVLNHRTQPMYSDKIAKEGYQKSMQGIKRYAQQGDQLARIENNGNPLISQIKSNYKDSKKELTLKWKPSPQIKASLGEVKTDYTPAKLKVNTQSSWPKSKLNWGKVEGYLDPEPKLEVQAVDVKA
ncbi:DUF6470 family protein [Halanaerobacter jeridensis]|uniref:Uncharacterized protein n=1 Tax=Halanaerobacter jeridensis TaxID=706427 RepID=A0A938XWD2_9FIRM|nr:DUF6470 family protein [Halanaerobacter jeridensis]MBM7557471.1 hypothetical protein [Halanaerobacter jeridensis]